MPEGTSMPESNAQFPDIVAEIDMMFKVDQDMRLKNLKEPDTWDENVDTRHTNRMKEIVAQIGWPTVSKVGKQSSSNAWLLVQHADRNIDFQEQCLTLMKQEHEGGVDSRNIAMLEDRIRVNKNQLQLYGTQFRQTANGHEPLPIEDEVHVDERRKEMGLPSLKENIAQMYEKYGSPKDG